MGALARRALEKDVVIGLAIERRIKLDEVYALIADIVPENG